MLESGSHKVHGFSFTNMMRRSDVRPILSSSGKKVGLPELPKKAYKNLRFMYLWSLMDKRVKPAVVAERGHENLGKKYWKPSSYYAVYKLILRPRFQRDLIMVY